MIIDAHSHWLPDEIISNAHFFHKGWGDIEAQLKMMEDSGIDRAVLSYPTSDAHLKLGSISMVAKIYNDNIAKIIKRFPDKFIAAAILPIDDSKEMLDEIRRATGLGFKAISLASSYNGRFLDDKLFLPAYKAAAENNIPIFVHSQIVNPIGFSQVNDPLLTPVVEYVFDMTISVGKLLMSGILRDYKAKFVFANFAGAIPYLQQRFDSTYAMLRGINFVKDLQGKPTDFLKDIYLDTGGNTIESNFKLALDLVGAEHVLWGSDWPAKKDIKDSLQSVRSLDIPESDKAAILGGNLEQLFI